MAAGMISVNLRSKSVGATQVLGPIKLEVAKGEILALVGRSGIGKTTLLRVIAGLDTEFDGQIDVPKRRAMVFQEPALLPWRNVLENLTLVSGVSQTEARDALNEVGLSGLERRFPNQLSLGQQRRLSLARALSASPDVLLMDEPFVSLDEDLVDEMLTLVEKILKNREIATVFVTHSRREATRLATRVVRLTGSPATISGTENID